MDNSLKVEMGFVQRRLPWIIAGAMFVVYLITLSWWITPSSAMALAKVAGWDWRPEVIMPLHVLLTLPVRWLPAGVQLVALNLFEALCAALALAVLARSVSLLPHDRTKDQRQLERSDYSLLTIPAAWVPPVLAALVCGLQLTFWENSVASNGEMLDLLVFAYLIRCLLEFRLDLNERWLKKFAFVYGLSVVNNYAMIGFFPAFLVALVWIKWATFFNWRFVGRMVLWGCLGLLLYLVLPVVASFKQTDYSFTELLRTYWGIQKTALASAPRHLLIFLVLTSFLPVLFIGIRWPASFGDISPTGQALTRLTTHLIHVIFLAACLYVTFDLAYSPRRVLHGFWAALPFYYLGALSIGYFAGYLLLVFGSKPDPNAKSWQQPSFVAQIVGKILVVGMWLILIGAPAALAWKNFPLVKSLHGPAYSRHIAVLADSLPAQRAAVLDDRPDRLYALEDALRKRSPKTEHILLESKFLQQPAYHRALHRKYGAHLTSLLTTNAPLGIYIPAASFVSAFHVNAILAELSRSCGLYYVHPSHGYIFESLYPRPAGAVYRMHSYTTNAISPPPLTGSELAAQDGYWKKLKSTELAPWLRSESQAGSTNSPARRQSGLDSVARSLYSRAFNHFGVEAQRSGDLKLAAEYFDSALQLNENNLYAYINRAFNRHIQAGSRGILMADTNVLKNLEPVPLSSDDRLNVYGPCDEPSIAGQLAYFFHQATLYRQAAQYLERSLFFEPTNINRRLFLISESLQLGMPDHALSLINDLRTKPPVPLLLEDHLDLTRAEAWAWYSKGDMAKAEQLLRAMQQQHPRESSPFTTLADVFLSAGNLAKAVAVYEEQLKLQPENFSALVNLAALLIRTGQHDKALPYLERALKLKPEDPTAIFNRGLCQLHLAQLVPGKPDSARVDAALRDFLQLSTLAPKAHDAYFGIAECYRLKQNKTEALKNYRRFQELAPSNHPDRPLVEQRVKVLKSGGF